MSILPSECQQALISGYILGNLSPGEAVLFAEMLAEDPSLQEQVNQMQQILDAAYNPPEVAPPSNLRDRLLTAAKTQKTEPLVSEAETAEDTENTKPRSKLPGILGAIALGTIALLGFNNYRLWRVTQTPDAVETSQRTYLLQGEDLPDRVQAQLIVDNKQLNATLNVSNLPPLPPEQAYALWTVVGKDVPYTTDEKGAILTAVFQVDAAGSFTREIALPQPHLEPQTIQKMAITVEDVAAPQAHTGSIVISSQ